MVAFPDSEIEPTLLNGTGLTPRDSNRNNDDTPANDTNVRKVRDQAFTIPRVTMPNGKDNYALKFDSIDDKKLSVDINPEPVFVKKVAGKNSPEIATRPRSSIRARSLSVTMFKY